MSEEKGKETRSEMWGRGERGVIKTVLRNKKEVPAGCREVREGIFHFKAVPNNRTLRGDGSVLKSTVSNKPPVTVLLRACTEATAPKELNFFCQRISIGVAACG